MEQTIIIAEAKRTFSDALGPEKTLAIAQGADAVFEIGLYPKERVG